MKKLKTFAVMAFVISIATRGYGQKIKLEEGDLSALKSEKSLAFSFTYDNMAVGKTKSESEYISKKTDEYNKKTPGKGDEWAKAWKDDRETLYEPGFIKEFEKYSSLQPDPKAKYTLIFKTTSTEPGFNIGLMRRNAEISGEVWIVETGDKSHVKAKISVTKAPGGTFFENDFATDERIATAYSAAGRGLGYFVKGKM